MTDAQTFEHGQVRKSAVLLVQLGTPDAPTPGAVRRYLAEFLSDRRVVEISPWLWQPLLRGVVLNTRPRQSAKKYAAIWREEGSPLRVFSQRQAELLMGLLGEQGYDVHVALAMRYGQPSIRAVLRQLRDRGVDSLVVLPLYPQYAGSTTASVFDAVGAELARWRELPELTMIKHFHDHPGYIEALARSVERYWHGQGQPKVLVMSFHGVPARTLALGDPYHCECHKTARLLAERLKLSAQQYRVTFQSRFGRAKWLEPATSAVLAELGRARTARVDVICPGFVADCLETLEEISIEARQIFTAAGGGGFGFIPCLNDSPALIAALADVVAARLPDGARRKAAALAAQDAQALRAQRDRAIALGAPR